MPVVAPVIDEPMRGATSNNADNLSVGGQLARSKIFVVVTRSEVGQY